MALYYLDTSALAKRYIPERGSPWITRLIATEAVAISELVIVATASTLARRIREGSVSPQDRDTIFEFFADRALLGAAVWAGLATANPKDQA